LRHDALIANNSDRYSHVLPLRHDALIAHNTDRYPRALPLRHDALIERMCKPSRFRK
jgi:hypothetical protein